MKIIKEKYSWFFFGLILLTSCSTADETHRNASSPIYKKKGPRVILERKLKNPETVSVVRNHPTIHPDEKKKVVPKKLYLVLECVSPLREFKAGQPAKMTFRMRNYEFKPIFIRGWMMKETNNIRLYYVPWKKNMKKPSQDQWGAVKPKIEKDPKTMTLELSPKNSVLLDVELPFVKDAKITEPKNFIIYAQIKVDYVIKNKIKVNTFILNSKYMKIKVKP